MAVVSSASFILSASAANRRSNSAADAQKSILSFTSSSSSTLILRFPPNFVRQLSIKARRNCSNIGVAQIVAASWSDRQSPLDTPPSATAGAETAPAVAEGDDTAAGSVSSGNGVVSKVVQSPASLAVGSFLSSDGSLAVHAGACITHHYNSIFRLVISYNIAAPLCFRFNPWCT
jgi:cystathionine gamma-synthase